MIAGYVGIIFIFCLIAGFGILGIAGSGDPQPAMSVLLVSCILGCAVSCYAFKTHRTKALTCNSVCVLDSGSKMTEITDDLCACEDYSIFYLQSNGTWSASESDIGK